MHRECFGLDFERYKVQPENSNFILTTPTECLLPLPGPVLCDGTVDLYQTWPLPSGSFQSEREDRQVPDTCNIAGKYEN